MKVCFIFIEEDVMKMLVVVDYRALKVFVIIFKCLMSDKLVNSNV